MSKQQQRLKRIRAVEREYLVALQAVAALEAGLGAQPSLLRRQRLSDSDLEAFKRGLEPTYLVKMYAEFEAGLRDLWAKVRKKRSVPKAEDLISSLGAKRDVPDATRDGVHGVRKYRNAIVHEGDDTNAIVLIGDARKHLCTFISFMPLDW